MTDTIHLPSESDAILAPESIALTTLLLALTMARVALRTEYPDHPSLGHENDPYLPEHILYANLIIRRIDDIKDLIDFYMRIILRENSHYTKDCFPF